MSDTPADMPARRPRAFVLLARGFGATAWRARFESGALIGMNEPLAYGYFHAADQGIDVTYGEDLPEGRLSRLLRLGIRAVTGFDFLHAWRQRDQIACADIVWTHTESQSLAVGAVWRLLPRVRRPRLLLQQIWLIDRWPGFSPLRRWVYRWLLAPADVLTFHSPLNTELAREIFPEHRCELVRFGIAADQKTPPRLIRSGGVLRVLALGSDRHRDWATLIDAVEGCADLHLTIVSGTIPAHLLAGKPNVARAKITRNEDLFACYAQADVVALSLKPNLHVSGSTVSQEAAVMGVPAVISDVGGLRAYFDDSCVTYVPPGDAAALRAALRAQATDPEAARQRALRAQAQMSAEGLSSRAFARDHARLSIDIICETRSFHDGNIDR
ncbi:glycosyltransferase involved in cell wall biosynthesis [Rhodobacter aestuarii]|uniref:Glycosyltransferase involved in cell wall bisynthesis n=1 Tax=Rhodobacter aestuarii TaxID=453582 RepID=A0A1N7MA73_9RHOB|nr:glycosyltransferase [Rhodobacter aestuarii]PTV94945.1 glycosyltransferase involved in cell wall biosynthesis [Rhodobacter aestuarii]SIS82879.1 Glycosyltransferase involved in cell wall bisynthesis [Rhodobacter aestuarii]